MSDSKYEIDQKILRLKNKKRISFSWGFEYRYLQELGTNLCNTIDDSYQMDNERLIIIRHPSIPAYANLDKYIKISRLVRLTSEVVCVEGEITNNYMLHLKGTLAYLMPGQCYLDAAKNIARKKQITEEMIADIWDKRKNENLRLTNKMSSTLGISNHQIVFNWGSGGSLELLLWSIKNNSKHQPKMLINVPNYFYTISLAQKFGYKINYILSYSRMNYKYPINKIIKELESNSYDIIVLTSPNNPFGEPITHADFKRILNCLPMKTVALIDFTGLTNKSEFHFEDILSQTDWRDKRIFMLDSLSKKYEMCHARVGYIITPNPILIKEFNIEQNSPVLTMYAYSKLEEALNHPEKTNRILKKHKRYYQTLKMNESNQFKIISTKFSNFIVSQFINSKKARQFILSLKQKYNYYDLPFQGSGKNNMGKGDLSQEFIQYLPKNNVRILEETSNIISRALKSFIKKNNL